MLVLDENIIETQRRLLRSWRIPVRQIGYDLETKGIRDEQVISFLHQQRHSTFFTCDLGFYDRSFCHGRYGIVVLTVTSGEVAAFVRRFLRDSRFKTRAQRMGRVFRLSSAGIYTFRLHASSDDFASW